MKHRLHGNIYRMNHTNNNSNGWQVRFQHGNKVMSRYFSDIKSSKKFGGKGTGVRLAKKRAYTFLDIVSKLSDEERVSKLTGSLIFTHVMRIIK